MMDGLLETEQKRLATIAEEFSDGCVYPKIPPISHFFGSAPFAQGNVHYDKHIPLQKDCRGAGIRSSDWWWTGIMEATNRGLRCRR